MRTSPYLLTPGDYERFTKVRPGAVVAPGPYLDNGEALRLEATTTDSSGTLRLFGRLLTMDGELVESFQDMVFSGTGAQTAVDMRMGRGWLVGFSVRAVSGTITDGEVVASVHLVRNTGSLAQHLACLASGEVTNTRALGLGAFVARGAGSGSETAPTIVTATNAPAAGADFSFTVTAGQTWQLQSLRAVLTTSAAVASRQPYLTVDDGANALLYIPNTTAVTASLTRDFNYANFGATWTSADSSEYQIPLPPLVLTAGYRIRAITVNLQAGDQWSGVYLTYRQY